MSLGWCKAGNPLWKCRVMLRRREKAEASSSYHVGEIMWQYLILQNSMCYKSWQTPTWGFFTWLAGKMNQKFNTLNRMSKNIKWMDGWSQLHSCGFSTVWKIAWQVTGFVTLTWCNVMWSEGKGYFKMGAVDGWCQCYHAISREAGPNKVEVCIPSLVPAGCAALCVKVQVKHYLRIF